MVLQLYYDWSNTDYIYLDCLLFLAVLFQMKKISWPWQFSRMAQRGGLVPSLTPTLGRFCGVVTPPKTNRWNPKNDGIEDEIPFISGWFFRFQCEVSVVCTSRPRKDYFFLPLPKLAPLKSTIVNYKHHQFWKIDNIPKQKNTELVSTTKTQRQEKPFRFSSNSLDGRTFRIVMATRLPATRLATSTRHHGDVLVLPAKQTWNPKNWLFLHEIKVFPLSLGSSA